MKTLLDCRTCIFLLLLLCACQKEQHRLSATQAWDGKQHAYDTCQSFTPYSSTGAIDPIPNNKQHVPLHTSPGQNPLDQVMVTFCDANGACAQPPGVYYIWGTNEVILNHAYDAGYRTWNVSEILCGL